MKKLKSSSYKKSRAQGMLEFALALPVLLMLLYGVLETGRLLFIYASTVTAARQAVRYGSASGLNTSNTPFYQDCTGIRAAAKNVGFINRFDDADILISYDHGLDFSGAPIQIVNPDPQCISPFPVVIQNGDRIVVQVSTQWQPIVSLVPLQPFTITAKSERTILVSIAIGVTAPPIGWVGYGTGTLTFEASPLQTSFSTLGEIITYNYTLSNLGTLDVVGPFAIVDTLAATSCPAGIPTTLTPGQKFPCTGTYQVTQVDLDTGTISNSAYATANGSPSPTINMSISANQTKSLALAITANPTATSTVGANITYTYTLTNTGNVTLSNPAVSGATCSGTSIAPGASLNCTSTYTVKNSDINNLFISKSATATATFGADTVTSNSATVIVDTGPLIVSISASPTTITAAGQVITFTYTLINNTAGDLGAPYAIAVSSPASGVVVTCPSTPATFTSASTITCTGTYTVTQANMDASSSLTHTITASAKQGGATVTSRAVSINVALVQTPGLSLTVSASPTTALTAGTVVTYTYTATNTGSVSLSSLAITNDKASPTTCAATSLVPGASTTCTSTLTMSTTDIDNGSVTLNATATAQFGATTATSPNASVTVITYGAPRLTLAVSTKPLAADGANTFVNYTYTLRNTGNAVLVAPYNIVDDKVTGISCANAASSIPIGGATVCSGSYITTAADVTNGKVVNTATATANHSLGTVSSTASYTLTVNPAKLCDLQHSVLKLPPFSAFGMTIFNKNSFPVTIQQVTVNWNDSPSSQAITAINLGGADVWTGSSSTSPSTFSSFVGNVTIDPSNSMPIQIKFGTTYTPFSPNQETISISFTNSPTCPALDSFDNGTLQ
jgi:uncharacterized repeat protein (TIGR01451 family)